MAVYLYNSCGEQKKAAEESKKGTGAMDVIREKVVESAGSAESTLSNSSQVGISTLLGGQTLTSYLSPSRAVVIGGNTSNPTIEYISALQDVGFCAVSAQISTAVRTMAGDTTPAEYASENPTVTGEGRIGSLIKSNTRRLEFPSGMVNAKQQFEHLSNSISETLNVLKDQRQSTQNRDQAFLDFVSFADQAIASGMAELTNSPAYKTNRKSDEKISAYWDKSLSDFTEILKRMRELNAENKAINPNEYLTAISVFRANCATLAKLPARKSEENTSN